MLANCACGHRADRRCRFCALAVCRRHSEDDRCTTCADLIRREVSTRTREVEEEARRQLVHGERLLDMTARSGLRLAVWGQEADPLGTHRAALLGWASLLLRDRASDDTSAWALLDDRTVVYGVLSHAPRVTVRYGIAPRTEAAMSDPWLQVPAKVPRLGRPHLVVDPARRTEIIERLAYSAARQRIGL